MDFVLVIARVLFALMYILGGLNHFTKAEGMTGYAQSKKVPMAKLSVLVSGLLMVLGGLSLVLGVWLDLGALVLAVVTFLMAVMMHQFWTVADAEAKQGEMISFLKNISMTGGALFMFAIAARADSTYGPAITESLFSIAG